MIRISRTKIDINLLKNRVEILKNTSRTLRELSKAPAPRNLTSTQQKKVAKYNQWLETSSADLTQLAKQGEDLLGRGTELMQATKAMQEMNQTFNLQYLKLQEEMQAQNRQFTLVSNIMKVKHDTAKSAINNVR